MKEMMIEFVINYGYIAMFLMLSLSLIGLPMPDETLLAYVGSQVSFGHLSFVPAIMVGFFGSLTGMTVSYSIGRKVGKPFLLRYGKWVFITPARLERTELWFGRFGVWTVTIGYFIPGVRHFTSYLAGISEIPFVRYILFAAAGALAWSTTFVSLGYAIGANWSSITAMSHRYIGFGVIAVVAVTLIAIVAFRFGRHNLKM